jgi:hypothetical protein
MDSTKIINSINNSLSKNDYGIFNNLSDFLTPIITILALYIAYQQFRTNKQRLLFETYEKRLAIYNAVQDYLSLVLRDAKTDLNKISDFRQNTSQAVFLFDSSVQNKIDEIFKKSHEMRELEEQLYPNGQNNGIPVGAERKRVSHEKTLLVKWHIRQLDVTKKLFSKKMSLK